MKIDNNNRKTARPKALLSFIIFMILLLILFVSGCSKTVSTAQTDSGTANRNKPVQLTISTAPSLKGSFDEIKKLYALKNPRVTLLFSYGPSGTLQTQIEQGAPTDIFISQGKPQMDALEQKGLIRKNTRVNLLGDELVLIVNNNNTTINSFSDLSKPEVQKIGIGEAQTVPAAKTTKETLETLKLWNSLQTKFVIGKDLNQIMAYVETGNADAGFVWDTIAKTSNKVKIAAIAPASSHQPVVLPAAVMQASKNSAAASAFLTYLQSDEAMQIFVKHGFIKLNNKSNSN